MRPQQFGFVTSKDHVFKLLADKMRISFMLIQFNSMNLKRRRVMEERLSETMANVIAVHCCREFDELIEEISVTGQDDRVSASLNARCERQCKQILVGKV